MLVAASRSASQWIEAAIPITSFGTAGSPKLMSRVRRDLYAGKLAALLSRADDERFFLQAWATSAIQSGREGSARRFINFPKEAVTTDLTSPWFIPPWKIETVLNELLATPKIRERTKGRSRYLDCSRYEVFRGVIHELSRLENAEDGLVLNRVNILREMHRLGQRQFEWQRGFFSFAQLYRAQYVYGGPLSRAFFNEANGVSFDDFTLACFALRASFQGRPIALRDMDTTEIGISRDAFDKIASVISISHADARKKAQTLRSVKGGHTSYKRSLFREYPCVRFGADQKKILCPLPDLITLRATSGLFYDLVRGPQDVKREIAARFETYCRDLIAAMLPGSAVRGDVVYGTKKRPLREPDILIEPEGAIELVVECKATRMSYEARFSENPVEQASGGYEELVKGVYQIWRFTSHVRRGVAVGARMSQDAKGVVLTLDNWLSMADPMQTNVLNLAKAKASTSDPLILECDQIPIIFCSIDDLEHTLDAATEPAFYQTVDAAAQERFRGWHLWAVHRDLKAETRGDEPHPFEARVSDVCSWWTRFAEETDRAS